MLRTITLTGFVALIAAATIPFAPAARAQIGNIFSDQPPRPPGAVPRGSPPPAPDDEEDVPELPQGGRVLPGRLPPGQGVPPPGAFQSQPLPPPPGSTVVPQNAPPAAAGAPPQQPPGQGVAVAPPGAPPAPGQRQPNQPKDVPQTPATLQPGDEIVTEPPAQKIINKKASFTGLDKITGRTINFDEAIGETVQFGALRIKTDACYTRPATEATNTDGFVEVDEITLQGEVKRIFSGWMFAASPGLHAVEHPIYDVWLTGCKDPETTVVSAQPDPPKPATPPPPGAQKRPPAQKQAVPRAPPPPPPQQQVQEAPPPPPQPRQQQPGGLFGIFRQ